MARFVFTDWLTLTSKRCGAHARAVSCAASLRFQCSGMPDHKDLSVERAFADFVFGNVILHLFVINFIG